MKIKELIPIYLGHLKALGRSARTISNIKYDLKPFTVFLDQEKIDDIDELTSEIMHEYQQELAFKITTKGTLFTIRVQGNYMSIAKGFTRFLKQRDYLFSDPGEEIQLPRKPKTLPRAILNEAQIQRLIKAPDTHSHTGYRNKVILELLYDTAVRRSEITGISLSDMDLTSGFVRIRGKGDKERMVPVSTRVCKLVKNYILSVRPVFLKGPDDGYLILNRLGCRMNGASIWAVVKRCAKLAGIKKNITPHGLRHTCATHMLKNGAPVRYLQEMLGHESLESTQIYTRVTINDLKNIHSKYHPGEHME